MDQYILYFLVTFLLTFDYGLLYYDSKKLGLSFMITMDLANKYCHKYSKKKRHGYIQGHRYGKQYNKEIEDFPLNQPDIFDFFKNRSLTVRFFLYCFSIQSSCKLWIEKQESFCWSLLDKLSIMIGQKLSNLFEDACDFWIYIQDLF
jgi:hypothetical protein